MMMAIAQNYHHLPTIQQFWSLFSPSPPEPEPWKASQYNLTLHNPAPHFQFFTLIELNMILNIHRYVSCKHSTIKHGKTGIELLGVTAFYRFFHTWVLLFLCLFRMFFPSFYIIHFCCPIWFYLYLQYLWLHWHMDTLWSQSLHRQ